MANKQYVNNAVVIYDAMTGTQHQGIGAVLDGSNLSDSVPNTVLDVPTISGMYLVSVSIRIMRPASGGPPGHISSSVGPITLSYVCADSSRAVTDVIATALETGKEATVNTENALDTSLTGSATICALAGQPISISVGYSSNGTVPMTYSWHSKSVFLGGLPG